MHRLSTPLERVQSLITGDGEYPVARDFDPYTLVGKFGIKAKDLPKKKKSSKSDSLLGDPAWLEIPDLFITKIRNHPAFLSQMNHDGGWEQMRDATSVSFDDLRGFMTRLSVATGIPVDYTDSFFTYFCDDCQTTFNFLTDTEVPHSFWTVGKRATETLTVCSTCMTNAAYEVTRVRVRAAVGSPDFYQMGSC